MKVDVVILKLKGSGQSLFKVEKNTNEWNLFRTFQVETIMVNSGI